MNEKIRQKSAFFNRLQMKTGPEGPVEFQVDWKSWLTASLSTQRIPAL